MTAQRHEELAAHSILPEPALLFAKGQTDTHPLRGLIANGPYSLNLGLPVQIRLAYLAPENRMRTVEAIAAELQGRAKVREAPNYYFEYPGFEQVFRIPVIRADDTLKFSPPDDCIRLAQAGNGEGLVRSLLHTMASIRIMRSSFDVLLVYLPPEWQPSFLYEGFNLHDKLKARIAPLRIPIQIINETGISRISSRPNWEA